VPVRDGRERERERERARVATDSNADSHDHPMVCQPAKYNVTPITHNLSQLKDGQLQKEPRRRYQEQE